VSDYGYRVDVPDGYDEAVVRTRLALKAEGFSILTEMHVGGLLGPEAGQERQYLIMGAWAAAAGAREVDPGLQVAVHVSCNFVVQSVGSGAIVAALDPGDGGEGSATEEARDALTRVFARITTEQ
jgi:hypothetical protein